MGIKEIVQNQREFFNGGATKDLETRRAALKRLKNAIAENESEILEALRIDLGKADAEAYMTEVGLVYSEISYMLKHMNRLARPKRVRTPLTNFPSKSTVYSEPFGSVLIMSPWNYPFLLTMSPLAGALAAGNCAVIKPSAYSPAVSDIIAKIIARAFSENYVAVVTGGRQANQDLLTEKFDYIFFTGGKVVGRQVMEAASKHLTPVTLELGGKSPCIVDETADIRMAARRIVWGKYLNCGQTCVAPDYVLVHRSKKAALIEAMKANIKALYGDEPIESKDFGKIINEKHFDRLSALLEGQKLYCGGKTDRERLKIEPTIMEADWDSHIMEDEIFGPIMPVLEFDNLPEAKVQIEARPRPLALYLFTTSKSNERYIIKNLAFGGGCINDTIMHLASSNMPFGGAGESGMGNYHGAWSFKTFSHEKSVLKKSLLIDVPLRYQPYSNDLKWLKLFLK